MSSKNINGSVESRERWLTRNLWESTVVRNEVNHFLLHILAVVLHALRTLGHTSSCDHVLTHLGGISFIVEGEAPVGGEGVLRGLCGNDNLSLGCKEWSSSSGDTSNFDKVATRRRLCLRGEEEVSQVERVDGIGRVEDIACESNDRMRICMRTLRGCTRYGFHFVVRSLQLDKLW